jgi:elongation factor Ts
MIDLEKIKKLREETLASFSLCKEALENSNWDIEKAKDYLRKKGGLKLDSRFSKETKNGIIVSYVHNFKIGVLVELRCETDFVASNEEFRKLGHEIALQIASMKPKYIRKEDISEEEKEKYIESLKDENLLKKPKEIQEKIIEGKLEKIYEETVLLEQPWIKNGDLKIKDLINEAVIKLGEKIEVSRFVIFQI